MHVFETSRLIGRRLCRRDTLALSAILGDAEVMKHSVHGVCDEQATGRFISWCNKCYSNYGIGPWALLEKNTETLIGFCGVGPEEIDGVTEFNLGYRLAKPYWRCGLASEAVHAALDDAFNRKLLASVIVIIEPAHTASLRVAAKAGFLEYQHRHFHGKSVRLYRLTSQTWQAAAHQPTAEYG